MSRERTHAHGPARLPSSMPDEPLDPPPSTLPVLAVVRDLMFSSRITQAGRHAGSEVKVVRDPATLAGREGRMVIADLNLDGAMEAAAAWKARTNRPAIGFVQHVDTDRIRAARAAGLDAVMPRSQFVVQLPDLLRPNTPAGELPT